jgi:hypothetical protein
MRNRFVRVLAGFVAAVAMTAVLRAQEQPAPTPPAQPAAKAPAEGTAAPPQHAPPATGAPAAQTPAQPATPGSSAGATAPAAPSAPATPADDDSAGPPGPAPTGKSPERFEPSEKVRADFDVSFPVDI